MAIFPLAPAPIIAQMWSNRVRGGNCVIGHPCVIGDFHQ